MRVQKLKPSLFVGPRGSMNVSDLDSWAGCQDSRSFELAKWDRANSNVTCEGGSCVAFHESIRSLVESAFLSQEQAFPVTFCVKDVGYFDSVSDWVEEDDVVVSR